MIRLRWFLLGIAADLATLRARRLTDAVRELTDLNRRHASLLAHVAEVERATLGPMDRQLAAQLADWLTAQKGWDDGALYVRMLRRAAGAIDHMDN